MLDTISGRTALISAIERARNSYVIAYVLHDGAAIADDAILQLYDKLEVGGHRARIDLLLVARAGYPEACWRVVTLLREYCDHLGVLIPYRAHGGGTLIALGAAEIVMGPLAELSSVAPQPVPPPAGSAEGLAEARALTSLVARNALALHLAAAEDAARIDQIVETLNGGLHSPGYPIARREARALGLPVTNADGKLWHDLWALYNLYGQTLYHDGPEPNHPGAYFRYVALVETHGRTSGLRQTHIPQADGPERVIGLRWETAIRTNTPGPPLGPDSLRRN